MPQRKIIHIDMDAFYASVEQRDDPSLRGRPIAVGHDGPRGVVSTASYEARPYGVRSALPSVTARRLCPELIFVPARFDVYKAVSQQIRAIFREYTELVEPLSLDEAFLDVTHELSSATLVAREIKARIRRETELTASAGVSVNKMLAKIASDYRKPDGLFTIAPSGGRGVRRRAARRALLRHRCRDGRADAPHGHPYGRRSAGSGTRRRSCSASARPVTPTTAMRAASTSARCSPTACASRSAPRRPSPKIPTTAHG